MPNSYNYSNTAVQTTLAGSISSGATSINVGATTGFPGSFPYTLALDFGSATEELVLVTAASVSTLTVTRGFSNTSAQSHSLGAVVRHVYHAGDAIDFRTHEAATASVHGVTGALVGATQAQTLTNKTLTAPAITNPAMTGGGSLSGTYTGTPTFSGALALTGGAAVSGGALTGTFTGSPTFTGAPTFTGTTTHTGEIALSNLLRTSRATATDSAVETRVTGDAVARWFTLANGKMVWGDGTAGGDTTLYRTTAGLLTTDGNFEVGGKLQVHGIGAVIHAWKVSSTTRTSTTTRTNDPHLSVSVDANAIYELSGMIAYQSTGLNGDLSIALASPAATEGTWMTYAPSTSATVEPAAMRSITNPIAVSRTYGAGYSSADGGMILSGIIRTAANSGTVAVSWAQATSDPSGTQLLVDSFICLRRVA